MHSRGKVTIDSLQEVVYMKNRFVPK